MTCYRKDGCGPYEMYSCSECPASKPEYLKEYPEKKSEIPKPTFAPYQALFYGCGINYPHCKEDCYWYKEEPHMGAHIPYCQNKGGNYIEPKDCENCKHYHSKYKKTNADRIRTMMDEELAEKFEEIQLQIVKTYGNDHLLLKGKLKKYWLGWLRQEANPNDLPFK